MTILDFNSSHPDFESPACYGEKNMVRPTLDADHKPFHLPSNSCADNQLHDWFRDNPSSARYCQDLTLTRKAGSENIFEKVDNLFFPIDNVPTKEATVPGEDGKIHNFHFFFCERQTIGSHLKMNTSIDIIPPPRRATISPIPTSTC